MNRSKNISPIHLLNTYLRQWKGRVVKASTYSVLNKLFDVAPEVLIGVAVDLVVKKNQSFVHRWALNQLTHRFYLLEV